MTAYEHHLHLQISIFKSLQSKSDYRSGYMCMNTFYFLFFFYFCIYTFYFCVFLLLLECFEMCDIVCTICVCCVEIVLPKGRLLIYHRSLSIGVVSFPYLCICILLKLILSFLECSECYLLLGSKFKINMEVTLNVNDFCLVHLSDNYQRLALIECMQIYKHPVLVCNMYICMFVLLKSLGTWTV